MKQASAFRNRVSGVCLILILLVTAATAYGYGGGGGGGGEDSVPQMRPAPGPGVIKPMSADEIRDVLSTIGPNKLPGLDPVIVSVLTTILDGREMSVRDLISIRQKALEAEGWSSQIDRGHAAINLIQVQILDGMGQATQIILTVIPGVGWAVNASLGAARAAADQIKDGGDLVDAGGAALLSGTTSYITKGISLGSRGNEMVANGARNLNRAATQVARAKVQARWTRKGVQQIAMGGVHIAANLGVSKGVDSAAATLVEIGGDIARQKEATQVPNQAPQAVATRQTVSVPEMRAVGGGLPEFRAGNW